MNKRWSLVLYCGCAALFAVWAYLPVSWTTKRPSQTGAMFHFDTITVLSPLIPRLLFAFSVVAAGLLLIVAVFPSKWCRVRYFGIAVLLAVVAFPYAAITHALLNAGRWRIYGTLNDATGNRYAFCDSSFLQEQVMALTRVETENHLFTRFTVLGANNGDSPRSWASVVRPSHPQDQYGQLYLTESNVLVGIRHSNACYLAYDLENQRFIGHGDIERISPFLCIDDTADLHRPDIDMIEDRLAELSPGTAGYPHRNSVELGLNHRNRKVRPVAERFLRMMDVAHDRRNMSEESGQSGEQPPG